MMNRIGIATRIDGRRHDFRRALPPPTGRRACSRQERPRPRAWGVRLAEREWSHNILPGDWIDLTDVVKAEEWLFPLIHQAASSMPGRRRAWVRRAPQSPAGPRTAMRRWFAGFSLTSPQSSSTAFSWPQDSCLIVRDLCRRDGEGDHSSEPGRSAIGALRVERDRGRSGDRGYRCRGVQRPLARCAPASRRCR